jgi:hypothetical protein
MTQAKPKNHFKKALLLITLILAFLLLYDRISIINGSQEVPATITSCESKWVKVTSTTNSTKYRDQIQFLPKATNDDGITAIGSVMLPTRAVCNLTIGSEVSILVHPTNADENRIYSFVQFWALPILFFSFPLIFFLGTNSITSVRFSSVIFAVGFVLLVASELGLFKGSPDSIDDQSSTKTLATNSTSSGPLNRCIYTSMKKEGVKREEIKKLICIEQEITNVSSLVDLTNLEELYLQNNELTSLMDVPTLNKLKIISVAGNKQLTSTQGIEKFPALEEFQANKSGLTDLKGVQQLAKLKVVGLMMNKIVDVSVFRHLEHIENVVLSYNPVTDISAFKNKNALVRFTAHGTKIKDVSPLIGNTKLKIVGVSSDGFLCSELEPLRAALPASSKVFGPSHCNKPK